MRNKLITRTFWNDSQAYERRVYREIKQEKKFEKFLFSLVRMDIQEGSYGNDARSVMRPRQRMTLVRPIFRPYVPRARVRLWGSKNDIKPVAASIFVSLFFMSFSAVDVIYVAYT